MKNILFAALALFLVFVSASSQAAYEKPPYTVKQSWDKIEVREYAPIIVAEITLEGEKKAALKEGFVQLAAYIFGKNTPYIKPGTAPTVQKVSPDGKPVKAEKPKGEKIPMTAPVMQQANTANGSWKIQFYMAPPHNLDTLPVPVNENIRLHQLPERKFAVFRFSGGAGIESLAKRTKELREYMKLYNLLPLGEPIEAYYDPPWIPPFLRHNEVMIEIR